MSAAKQDVHVGPVTSPQLRAISSIVHGFSTRLGGVSTAYRSGSAQDGGDLNLGYSEQDEAECVRTNRQRWLNMLNVDAGLFRFALLRQEHSATIHVIGKRDDAVSAFTQPGTRPGDGLITNLPGVLLTVQTADCIPVLLCDPVRHAVGAFHAGWRGTLARIVEQGIKTMRDLYGSDPADFCAAIGPGIGPGSYAVGSDLKQKFAERFDYAGSLFRETGQQLYLDLWEANRQQLLRAGVPAGNIDALRLDTATDITRFFSYRAENGHTGRMMSSIGLQPRTDS